MKKSVAVPSGAPAKRRLKNCIWRSLSLAARGDVKTRLAHPNFVATLQLRFFYDESDSRASTRRLRLLAQFRGPLGERGARSEAAPDRFVRLRPRCLERRAVHDRAKRCLGFLDEKRGDGFRHVAEGAAGLGRVREWLLHSVLRLQRYLSFQRAGASER